jgi:hypothetical protein
MDDAAFVYWMSALDSFLPSVVDNETSQTVASRLSALGFHRISANYGERLPESSLDARVSSDYEVVEANSEVSNLDTFVPSAIPESELTGGESDPYTQLLNSTASLRQDVDALLGSSTITN